MPCALQEKRFFCGESGFSGLLPVIPHGKVVLTESVHGQGFFIFLFGSVKMNQVTHNYLAEGALSRLGLCYDESSFR